jgi:hypothetical protein
LTKKFLLRRKNSFETNSLTSGFEVRRVPAIAAEKNAAATSVVTRVNAA